MHDIQAQVIPVAAENGDGTFGLEAIGRATCHGDRHNAALGVRQGHTFCRG